MITLEATDIEQAHQYFAHTLKRVTDATTGLSEAQYRFNPPRIVGLLPKFSSTSSSFTSAFSLVYRSNSPLRPFRLQTSTAGRLTLPSSTKFPTVPSGRRLRTLLRQPASSHHRSLLSASLGVTSASPTMWNRVPTFANTFWNHLHCVYSPKAPTASPTDINGPSLPPDTMNATSARSRS